MSANDDDEPREYLGRAVENGTIKFFSVSALEKADVRESGCVRKYHYRYVVGIKDLDDEKASVKSGKALHTEIKTYLRTGVRALSALALRGLHFIPDPGPDLLVEQTIGSPRTPFVTAAGVPLIGFIDCAHDRGTNKGTEDIREAFDPPGTVEVIDWKWKGDGKKLEYFKQPPELIKTIQMSGYGVFISKAFPRTPWLRLSHGYFPVKGRQPFKSSKLHVIDDAVRSWEYTEGLARVLKDVAQERNPDRVPANPMACGKYGGCQYRDKCTAYQQTSTAMLFGETQSQELSMSLIQTLPSVLQPQAAAPVTFTQPAAVTIDPRAALIAEEAMQRAQAQATQSGVPVEFTQAITAIQQSGRGFPSLGGAAAQMFAAMGGQNIAPNSTYPGVGDLGAIMMLDPTHVVQLGNEFRRARDAAQPQAQAPVAQAPVTQQPQVPSPLPPDAPQSNPALAAMPIEGYSQPVQHNTQAFMHVPTATLPQVQMQAPATPSEPKRRGRKPKAVASAVATPGAPVAAAPQASGGYEVFVDCRPNCEAEDLHAYLDGICEALVSKFCPPPCLPDVRCAPRDSALGFGGWAGAIRAIALEHPPAPGVLFLDTRGNPFAEVLADALLTICDKHDGLYVRGVK